MRLFAAALETASGPSRPRQLVAVVAAFGCRADIAIRLRRGSY